MTSEQMLVQAVWRHYEVAGRHDLPWRQTHDPYHIAVSECMLQQTQVDRVRPKYVAFLAQFPTVAPLAQAPLADVLVAWQGLGYNRRAKLLHAAAGVVCREYGGRFPATEVALRQLPGVGPYTARAILTFAYGVPLPLIETNIRTVYIHHLFRDETAVLDEALWPAITATLDTNRPRDWYYALMDYGSHLKRTVGNNIAQSRHYKPQSAFVGSDRQIRGAVLRALATATTPLGAARLRRAAGQPDEYRFDQQLAALLAEGLVQKVGRSYRLPR